MPGVGAVKVLAVVFADTKPNNKDKLSVTLIDTVGSVTDAEDAEATSIDAPVYCTITPTKADQTPELNPIVYEVGSDAVAIFVAMYLFGESLISTDHPLAGLSVYVPFAAPYTSAISKLPATIDVGAVIVTSLVPDVATAEAETKAGLVFPVPISAL